MISGRDFAGALERQGFDFFAGVPCALIEDLIAVLERSPRAPYVAALSGPSHVAEAGVARSREGERRAGEGLAAAGSRPTAMAQPGDKSSTSDHRNYGRQREDGGRDRAGQAPLPLAPATMTRLTAIASALKAIRDSAV